MCASYSNKKVNLQNSHLGEVLNPWIKISERVTSADLLEWLKDLLKIPVTLDVFLYSRASEKKFLTFGWPSTLMHKNKFPLLLCTVIAKATSILNNKACSIMLDRWVFIAWHQGGINPGLERRFRI